MLRRIAQILSWFLIGAPLLSADPLAIQPGEKFTYRLSWGPFRHAGSLEILADQDPLSESALTRITSHTATRGFIRLLYRFDGWGQFFYQPDSGRLLHANAWTESSSKKTNATMTLDYETMKADYVDHIRPHRSLELVIPREEPFDFLTSLMQSRVWEIEIGQELTVPVLFDDELYHIAIAIDRREAIKTPWGRREALVLIPHMKQAPKGMFEDGGSIQVWVSDDERRLPLKFQLNVAVGTAMATLTSYQTDAAPPPAGSATPHSSLLNHE